MMRSAKQGTPGLAKVTFHLEPGSWHGSATETVWAEPVAPGQYRLRNVPFYAFDVSYDDVVGTREETGRLIFGSVLRRGGHSTYRLLLKEPLRDQLESFWKPLADCGCTYEEGHRPLLAVDVPADADIFEVYRRLEAGEVAGVWSFEEGHCGHQVKTP
jgi:hypothetical protein